MLQIPINLIMFARSNWTPRFPRAWRNKKITVCANDSMHKCRMEAIRGDHFEQWSLPYGGGDGLEPPPRAFYFKDEGVTWVMGWKGPVVDAFKVTVALRTAA